MTAKTLTTVTQDLITTYGNTARHVVAAYRQGNVRAAGYVDQTWAAAVEKAGLRWGTTLGQRAVQAQKTLSSSYLRGVTQGSDQADRMLDRVVDLAVRGVDQVAARASRLEQATGLKALRTLAQVAVPAAASVVQVAQRVEAQSVSLARKLSGPDESVAAAARPKARRRATAKTAATRRGTLRAADVKPTSQSRTSRTARTARSSRTAPTAR